MILSNKDVAVTACDLGLCISYLTLFTDQHGMTEWVELGRLCKRDPKAPADLYARVPLKNVEADEMCLDVEALTVDGQVFLDLMAS